MKTRARNFFRCSKRYITILESMIALFLLSILLVIVFGFFHELSVLNQESKKVIKERFKKQYVESRLAFIFSHITNENSSDRIFYFFSTKDGASPFPSLLFTYDNDPSSDPRVGGDVLARLFVDHQNRLCLAIWPLEKKENGQTVSIDELQSHMKIEYLLEDVEEIKFAFLSSPFVDDKQTNQPDPSKMPPKGGWHLEWNKEYKQMPVIVKLEISHPQQHGSDQGKIKRTEKEVFAFVLPSSKNPINFTAK